jgi:hypothetical protein
MKRDDRVLSRIVAGRHRSSGDSVAKLGPFGIESNRPLGAGAVRHFDEGCIPLTFSANLKRHHSTCRSVHERTDRLAVGSRGSQVRKVELRPL